MKILHGTWIPRTNNEFIQLGEFYLWGETTSPKKRRKNELANRHPFQLESDELSAFLVNELGLKETLNSTGQKISTKYFILPRRVSPMASLETKTSLCSKRFIFLPLFSTNGSRRKLSG